MKKLLKYIAYLLGTAILLVGAFVVFCFYRFEQISQQTFNLHPEIENEIKGIVPNLEIGKRIYFVRSGCVDCHGPDLSGAKIIEAPPMGSIWGSNISPYRTKNMSDADIVRAIRYGVHQSGRSLRGMSSFDYVGLSKEDIVSVAAFIRSMPEVNKESHVNTYGPITKIMGSLGKMPIAFPALFIDQNKGFETKPEEAPTVAFGKYLGNACVGCHGQEYTGGPIPGGDPSWPPAAFIRLGAAKWTEDEFRNLIKTKTSKYTGKEVRTPMREVLNAMEKMDETELKALWLYFSSLN